MSRLPNACSGPEWGWVPVVQRRTLLRAGAAAVGAGLAGSTLLAACGRESVPKPKPTPAPRPEYTPNLQPGNVPQDVLNIVDGKLLGRDSRVQGLADTIAARRFNLGLDIARAVWTLQGVKTFPSGSGLFVPEVFKSEDERTYVVIDTATTPGDSWGFSMRLGPDGFVDGVEAGVAPGGVARELWDTVGAWQINMGHRTSAAGLDQWDLLDASRYDAVQAPRPSDWPAPQQPRWQGPAQDYATLQEANVWEGAIDTVIRAHLPRVG
jgi:hypothetical protein